MAQNGEEIVGGNSIIALDGDDGNNNNNSIIGRQYSDHPEYHPLVAALKSRSYGGNLTAKKEVLLKFRPSELDTTAVERYWRDPDLYKHYFRHLLDHLHRHSLKPSDITKFFKAEFVAEALSQLFVLNEWNKALPVPLTRNLRERGNDPSARTKAAFVSLTRYVGPILKKYHEDQAKKKKSTRSKVNMQQTGIRIQDTVLFDPNYITKDP